MQNTSKTNASNQPRYFVRYLSLIPVIAVIAISLAFTLWAMINVFSPDMLFYPE